MEGLMKNTLIRFMKEDHGATAAEYGIIASLVAVTVVSVLLTLGPQFKTIFHSITDNLQKH